MDTLSHGLWSSLAAKATNRKFDTKINYWAAFGWGAFPDLFAFTVPFVYLTWNSIFGGFDFSDFKNYNLADLEPLPPSSPLRNGFWLMDLAASLYNYSHSLIMFLAVIVIIYLFSKKIPLAMIGWPLHILMDVPTHTYRFFPTPVLWPISDIKFNGIAWGTPWFLVLNYSCLLLTFLYLRHKKKS